MAAPVEAKSPAPLATDRPAAVSGEVEPRQPVLAPQAEDEEPAGRTSQRDKLIVVADRAEFWRSPEGISYATIPAGDHREHHKVRSLGFRDWLLIEAGNAFPAEVAGRARPGTFGKNAVEDALCSCEAMAAAGRVVRRAALRVAEASADEIYLDLGGPEWDAVKITPAGWSIVGAAAAPIVRTRRTRPLPRPVKGGALQPLRSLLPIEGDDEWRLTVLWLLAALRPAGPYPILALSGEEGTGKSFTAKVLRRLVDPCGDNIMPPPREDRDLIAAAKGNHILSFDNLSNMPSDLADSLCRLATGGDIGGRQLYTDDDSASFAAQRPIIVNGIPDLVTRGDLASRAIFVRLVPMKHRQTEAELWAIFAEAAPGILGALLDALCGALQRLPSVTLPKDSASFRMADFALLSTAAEGALGWPSGSACDAIRRNRRNATAMMADLDPIALAVRALVETSGPFSGLVSSFFARINEAADLDIRRSPGWPKHAARLGEHLRRVAPALRATGINVTERRTKRGMEITIESKSLGEALSLSLVQGGKEGEEAGGQINSVGFPPTRPTPEHWNGGTPLFSRPLPGVGGVGGVGGSYTTETLATPGEAPSGVGGVGEIAAEFIAADLPAGAEVEI